MQAFRRHDYAAASDVYTSLQSHFPDVRPRHLSWLASLAYPCPSRSDLDRLQRALPQSHPASADLTSNLALTDSLTDFLSSGYLDALRDAEDTLDIDDLEEAVPHVPVASGSTLPSAAESKAKSAPRKRRHALPKGAAEADAGTFQEDVSLIPF